MDKSERVAAFTQKAKKEQAQIRVSHSVFFVHMTSKWAGGKL